MMMIITQALMIAADEYDDGDVDGDDVEYDDDD